MTLSPEKSPGGAVAICRSPAPTGFCLYGDKDRPWQYPRCVCDSGRAQLNSLPGRCQGIPCKNAGVAQLVEHELPKLGVAGSNPVARSSIRDMSVHVAQMSMTNSPPAERKGQLLVILLSHKRRQCLLRLKKVNIISGAHAGKVRNNHFAMAVTKTPE